MDGLVPDVMHDILEGSLQYEVKEILKHFINTEKYFTLDELKNKKISEFSLTRQPDQQQLLQLY